MIIKCEDRYNEALEHAKKTEDETLQKCFRTLERFESANNATVYLMSDFAPLSFYFELLDETGRRIMNGGVIYHGNPDESFSVTMDKTIGWQVHT